MKIILSIQIQQKYMLRLNVFVTYIHNYKKTGFMLIQIRATFIIKKKMIKTTWYFKTHLKTLLMVCCHVLSIHHLFWHTHVCISILVRNLFPSPPSPKLNLNLILNLTNTKSEPSNSPLNVQPKCPKKCPHSQNPSQISPHKCRHTVHTHIQRRDLS